MKVSDFIVEYLISKGVTDVFGYPGGMVTHLMDSFSKYSSEITAHVSYHEQAAAFAACGYAQTSGKLGVAYATSGPGATNLITGICNAYFDSIPTLFITGQVNTFESKSDLPMRQRGFQETDIISMVKSVTKYCAYVDSVDKLVYHLDKAYESAFSGRRGPVLLDIPMNIFRSEIDFKPTKENASQTTKPSNEKYIDFLKSAISSAKRPCFLVGNGVKISGMKKQLEEVLAAYNLPIVTSMIAFDVFSDNKNCYGFIGAYGNRCANFIVAKSDLIISVGSRLDVRQVGAKRENFAGGATIIRFDVDEGEFSYKVNENEYQVLADISSTIEILNSIKTTNDYSSWLNVCENLKDSLSGMDNSAQNLFIEKASLQIPENCVITTDVGQNQVWVAQSFKLKSGQTVLFSGGLGAMGYSLPAAIGAYHASKNTVVCFVGDGGLQMNIQELEYVAREKLPIKIIVLNNKALGMIRHFQEMYFEGNYFQTKNDGGYTAPDFCKIANAYGIESVRITQNDALPDLTSNLPILIEVVLDENTYVFPKLEFGKPNQDQEPLIDRQLYNKLMEL